LPAAEKIGLLQLNVTPATGFRIRAGARQHRSVGIRHRV